MSASLLQRLRAALDLRTESPYGWAKRLDDPAWFKCHDKLTTGAKLPASAHRDLPELPTPEQQVRFAGCSGTDTLRQAFRFYQLCRQTAFATHPLARSEQILDFGCGWGRIARFWLRDANPSQIWCIDCLADAIDLIRSTQIPVNILKNEQLPPVAGLPQRFRLIYAFSVFSHLSENVAVKWIEYFAGLLQPGGYLIFTTMGLNFLATLSHLRRVPPQDFALQRTLQLAPPQDELEARYAAGEFVYFGTGGGGELSEDFYGNAIIPEAWLRNLDVAGLNFCSAQLEVKGINQTVVVMQKAA